MPNMYERFSSSSNVPLHPLSISSSSRKSGRVVRASHLRGALASSIQRGGTKHNNKLNYVLRHGDPIADVWGCNKTCKTGAVAALVQMMAAQ